MVKRSGIQLGLLVLLMMMCGAAFAAEGVSDGTGGLDSFKTWFNTIIPILAALGIAGLGIAWGLGFSHASWIPKAVVGILIAGASSYLVGLWL